MNDIYDRAIAHYGDKKQLLQACEECAELIQAISKATRYEGKSYHGLNATSRRMNHKGAVL